MAQSTLNSDSPARVLRATRRHRRMTRRTSNTKALEIAERIEPAQRVLVEKMSAAEAAQEAVEDALDDWMSDDSVVDATIGSLSRKAEDYDAENPNARTHRGLFDGVAPSTVASLPRDEQPDTVVKIIERGSALPPEHPALPILTALAAANDRARESQRAYEQALTKLREAQAAVEVAKIAVVQVYRDNVIDITRAVGSEVAGRCFPRLRRSKKASAPGDDGQE